MSDYNEPWRVEACENFMESAFNKGICLTGTGLTGVLGDFESALQFKPNCAPILHCCAMLNFVLDKKPEARQYYIAASRNRFCFRSQIIDEVCRFVWVEYMKWTTLQGPPLFGEPIRVEFQQSLPPLPPQFQSDSQEAQVFKAEFHFSLAIERIAETVELTLTLEHAVIEVSNFKEEDNFQGYFPYAYDLDVSPSGPWMALESSRILTVRAVGPGQSSQPIQQQQTAGYNVQVGIGGETGIPAFAVTYTSQSSVSSSRFPEVMTASKDTASKAMRMSWKVNTYEKGKPFAVKPVRTIRKLPFLPSSHTCNEQFQIQGKWVLSLESAGALQYEFHWMVQLKAKLALLPRISRNFFKSAPEPLTYDYASARIEMSDLYSTSMARMFQYT